MTRKTYGRVDIGRIELEGGWFPGEDYSLEVSLFSWHKRMDYLCLMYLQVAKLCVSVGINLGPSKAAVAEWGRRFEAAAKREPKASAPEKGIDHFEVGKSYRWTRGSIRPDSWSIAGLMDGLLDGKPHKCIDAAGTSANFADIPGNSGGRWSFCSSIGGFEEASE